MSRETFVWYLKWTGSIILTSALLVRVLDPTGDYKYYDHVLNLIGCVIWVSVGIIWKERSIVIAYIPYVIILTVSLLVVLVPKWL